MTAALELIDAAEAAQQQAIMSEAVHQPAFSDSPCQQPLPHSSTSQDPRIPLGPALSEFMGRESHTTAMPAAPFVWRNGAVRIAADARQVSMYSKTWGASRQSHPLSKGSIPSHEPSTPSASVSSMHNPKAAAAAIPLRSGTVSFLSAQCLTIAQLDILMPGLSCPVIEPLPAGSDDPAAMSPAYAATKLKHENKIRSRGIRASSSGLESSSSVHQTHTQPADPPVVADALDLDGTSVCLPHVQEAGLGDSATKSIAALFIPDGLALNVPHYLEALWYSCQVGGVSDQAVPSLEVMSACNSHNNS